MCNNEELIKKLDELAKKSDYIISNPETIKAIKGKGLPVNSVFETYEQYLDKVFNEKRAKASEIVKNIPHLSDSIANATLQSLYDEFRETFVMGIFGASIILCVIMLELALKYKLFDKRIQDDPNSLWEDIEKRDFTATINELKRKGVLSEAERKELESFNVDVRNPYIHYNVQKLLKGMVLAELPAVNVNTGEVTVYKDVDVAQKPFLWFSGKKVLDKTQVINISHFVINWVNKIDLKE